MARIKACGASLAHAGNFSVFSHDDGSRRWVTEATGAPICDEAGVIICPGGDGTLLSAADACQADDVLVPIRYRERPYRYCHVHHPSVFLARARAGIPIWELPSIVATVNTDQTEIVAWNEICVLNFDRRTAARLKIVSPIDGYMAGTVGDGLIVSTPYGSSGYFRSVTHGIFKEGLGVAYPNNCDGLGFAVLGAHAQITITIEREKCVVFGDNNVAKVNVVPGDRITIRRGKRVARVAGLDALFCNDCRDADDLPAGRRHF